MVDKQELEPDFAKLMPLILAEAKDDKSWDVCVKEQKIKAISGKPNLIATFSKNFV